MNTDDETEQSDTLYFNAFTEDLFSWDNDLENDSERKLKLNTDSSFFAGLESMEMDNRIRTCSTATPTSSSGSTPPPGRWSSSESSG